MTAKTITKLIPTNVKPYLKKGLEIIKTQSLLKALKEQGFSELIDNLIKIVPDINDQYSSFQIDTPYLNTKVRGLHAFQISLVNEVISDIESSVIVDIGDSAGTHLQYLQGLYDNSKRMECLSVNLDSKAVERIRKKGLNAALARAEDLQSYNIKADIFLCFETLEHLMNPCFFLHELSTKTNAKYLIVTVPYLKRSRVGLHHIRGARRDVVNAENTHIFELCPTDWKLLVQHSGWKILYEKIYLQYPKHGLFRLTQPFWKIFDFQGFYGLVLKRDNTWSSKYLDW